MNLNSGNSLPFASWRAAARWWRWPTSWNTPQGAVSQQIAALQKAVNTPLVAKVGRKVVLTDAGTVLAEHARGDPGRRAGRTRRGA